MLQFQKDAKLSRIKKQVGKKIGPLTVCKLKACYLLNNSVFDKRLFDFKWNEVE